MAPSGQLFPIVLLAMTARSLHLGCVRTPTVKATLLWQLAAGDIVGTHGRIHLAPENPELDLQLSCTGMVGFAVITMTSQHASS